MSWIKSALKAAATEAVKAVAPPSYRTTRDQMKDHILYIRSFADATLQEKSADWDKLVLNYRLD